jgi:hypothetical protein
LAGAETDIEEFNCLLDKGDMTELQKWLKTQTWYGTAGDMEHLRKFWHSNFGKRPDFKPNYIVPNMSSIFRCLSGVKGWRLSRIFFQKRARCR